MTRQPLTAAQMGVYVAILTHVRDTGQVPTIRDLMGPLGIRSPNGIVCHLVALQRKGWLTYGGTARGIAVPELTAALKAAAAKLLD